MVGDVHDQETTLLMSNLDKQNISMQWTRISFLNSDTPSFVEHIDTINYDCSKELNCKFNNLLVTTIYINLLIYF